jgi:outer membrane receptor protein involved in Fe transport
VTTSNRSFGFYVSDTIAIAPQWSLLLAGRYNVARIVTQDLTGESPAINGTNSFRRFNPAVGLTWTAGPSSTYSAASTRGRASPLPSNSPVLIPPRHARFPTSSSRIRR